MLLARNSRSIVQLAILQETWELLDHERTIPSSRRQQTPSRHQPNHHHHHHYSITVTQTPLGHHQGLAQIMTQLENITFNLEMLLNQA